MTCFSSGSPANGCRTFGRSEFIRLPWPAAKITTESCMQTPCAEILRGLAFLAQAFYGAQLRQDTNQFRLGLGDIHLVAAVAHRVFGALLRGQCGGLIQIAGAYRRV